jgi:hypothetical protein
MMVIPGETGHARLPYVTPVAIGHSKQGRQDKLALAAAAALTIVTSCVAASTAAKTTASAAAESTRSSYEVHLPIA